MNNLVLLRFTKFEHETTKAYLVRIYKKELWLPKKMCKYLIINKKLGGNVQIPEWLYKEKLGYEPLEEDYIIKVEIVTPRIIEFDPNEKPNESLIK